MKHKAIALAAALAAFSVAANQAPIEAPMTATEEQQTFGEQSAENVKQVKKNPRKEVEAEIKAYKRDVEAQLAAAGRNNMVTVVSGSAQVATDKLNPAWSRFRANALRQAVANAKQSHLQGLNSNVRNSVVMEFFSDEGAPTPSAEDFKTDAGMAGVLDKAIALLDAKLDSELREAGIDPNTFTNSTPTQKQELMRDYFAEETVTTAFGDMSGMFVIKTFESYTEDGKGSVGVVLAKSVKKRDKLKAMIESKGQVKPDPARANPEYANVEAALAANDAPYLEYGTTLAYDDQGYPMIISFGQAGVQYTDNERQMDKKRKAATKQAQSNAMANLAQAYNMSGNFVGKQVEERTEVQEVVHKLASSTSVTTLDPGMVDTLRTVIDDSTKMTASVNGLNGLRTVNEWNMEHPITGHEMVGLALVWHPVQVKNAELMQSGRTAEQIQATQKKPGPQKVTTQQSKSRFNSDF